MICPQRARKDIICYKVVRKRKYETGKEKYETPCVRKGLQLYSTVEAEESIIMPKKDYSTTLYFCHKNIRIYIVEEGYVHCLTSIEDARMWIRRNFYLFPRCLDIPCEWAIIKCVIPKGVLYCKSVDHKQICAKQIFTKGIELQG